MENVENIEEPSYEYVILVDEQNNPIGTAKKSEVHNTITPLHRAFSCFIFNDKNELLLQQRAGCKKTWPLVWSNSVCGHPKLDESNSEATIRRSCDELGVLVSDILEISPYRYRASRFGIEENEICPILVARVASSVDKNIEEVEDTLWISWTNWLDEIVKNKEKYSVWCVEETELLDKSSIFLEWMNKK